MNSFHSSFAPKLVVARNLHKIFMYRHETKKRGKSFFSKIFGFRFCLPFMLFRRMNLIFYSFYGIHATSGSESMSKSSWEVKSVQEPFLLCFALIHAVGRRHLNCETFSLDLIIATAAHVDNLRSTLHNLCVVDTKLPTNLISGLLLAAGDVRQLTCKFSQLCMRLPFYMILN